MKNPLCGGYIAALLCEGMSACVCTPSGTVMREDNGKPCACVLVCVQV